MNRITVTDRDGWRKDFTVQKSIVYIGSDPANDVVLDGARGTGVAGRQLQLLSLAANGVGYRLVNLGSSDLVLGVASDRALSPFASAALKEGDQIRLGDFTLIFSSLDAVSSTPMPALPSGAAQGAAAAPVAATAAAATSQPVQSAASTPAAPSQPAPAPAAPASVAADTATTATSIGMRLVLPPLPLSPDQPLEGTIVVRNQGSRPGAQFRLQVEGLDPSWYEIGPSPILFPNAEKEIPLRIIHPRKPNPPAGEFRFSVRASAPEAYPREVASVTQTINILPYYSHKLRWLTTG